MAESTPTLGQPVALGKGVYRVLKAEDVPFKAGAIAYQAFVSLIPLLVLLVVVAATVGGQNLVERILDATGGQLPMQAQQLLRGVVRSAAGQTSASVIGVVTLVWGAFKIFRGLDKAFSDLFDTERKTGIVDTLEDGAVVFGAIVFAIFAMLVAGSVFAVLPDLPLGGYLPPVLLVGGLFVAFLPMYYVFPDLDMNWRDVVPGALLAAVGWAVLEGVFQYYVQLAGKSDAYGVLGAVLVLVTWLYFSGLLLLIGASLNAVIAGRGTAEHHERIREDNTVAPDTPEDEKGQRTPVPDRGDDAGPVTSIREFERSLDALVAEAQDQDVSDEALVAALRQRVRSPGDVWGPDSLAGDHGGSRRSGTGSGSASDRSAPSHD
ncbi:MAG: YihY/virulence factor BrkB family protein [Haloarculaceae archaeon]